MRGRRYSEVEITALLREVARRRAQGETLAAVCEALGFSPSSHRRWRKKFGTDAEDGQPRAHAENSTRAQDPKLSDEARKLLDAANAASAAARNACSPRRCGPPLWRCSPLSSSRSPASAIATCS